MSRKNPYITDAERIALAFCPFSSCGDHGDIGTYDGAYTCYCLKCGAETPKFSRKEDAVRFWNTRAPSPTPVTVSEEMVDAALSAAHPGTHPIGDDALDHAYRSQMRAALIAALITNKPTDDGWISCAERMPELYESVIGVMEVQGEMISRCLTLIEHEPILAEHTGKKWVHVWQGFNAIYPEVERVTHWRPLPNPPTTNKKG